MSSHPFGNVPADVVGKPEPYTIHISNEELKDFQVLLEHSKIGPETWESKQEKFGVTREWLINAKKTWLGGQASPGPICDHYNNSRANQN